MTSEPGRGALSRTRRRRRRRVRLRVFGAALLAVAALAGVALAGHHGGNGVRAAGIGLPQAGTTTPPAERPSPPPDPEPRWDAFAHAGGVTLYLPAEDPVAIVYHEAAFHDALALHPLGHIVHNYNKWKFDSPKHRTPGPNYMVASSRGRDTPATSAADVVLRHTTPFRSPVTGRVVEVRPYHLYCRYPDLEVKIRPAGETGHSVVMIHLRGLRVRPGDEVFATLSVIGFARVFPFRSQVDDYVLGGNPHVHIEITRPSQARRPTC